MKEETGTGSREMQAIALIVKDVNERCDLLRFTFFTLFTSNWIVGSLSYEAASNSFLYL